MHARFTAGSELNPWQNPSDGSAKNGTDANSESSTQFFVSKTKQGWFIMRLRIPMPVAAILSLFVVMSSASLSQAQSGCARCAPPVLQALPNRSLVPTNAKVQQTRSNRITVPSTPPVLSPYYMNEPDVSDSNQTGVFVPARNVNQPWRRRLGRSSCRRPGRHRAAWPDAWRRTRAVEDRRGRSAGLMPFRACESAN